MDYFYDENYVRPDGGRDELSAEWAEYLRRTESVCQVGEQEGDES